MKQKRMTFGELSVGLSKLSQEQLAQPVIWVGEERGGLISRLEMTDEELVNFGEGLEPWSSYEGGEYSKADATAVYPVGTPFLHADEYEEIGINPDDPMTGAGTRSGPPSPTG